MKFALAFPRYSNQPSVYDRSGRKADVIWTPDLRLGTFPSSLEAKKSFLIQMKEIHPGVVYSDDHIRGMFRYFTNTQAAKVVRIKDDSPIDLTKTKARAAKVKMPARGEVIKLPVDVALAFMKLHNLQKVRWDGGVLIVRKSLPSNDSFEKPVGDPDPLETLTE